MTAVGCAVATASFMGRPTPVSLEEACAGSNRADRIKANTAIELYWLCRAAQSKMIQNTFVAAGGKERKKARLSWYHPDDTVSPCTPRDLLCALRTAIWSLCA